MKRFLIGAATVALWFVGCAREAPTALYFGWRGSPEGLQLARAAAQEWTEVCGLSAFVMDAGGAELDGVVPVVEVATAPGRLGFTHSNDDGRVESIHVLRQADPVLEQTTIAHELGHAFGILQHAPTGLMTAVWHGEEHVSPNDCVLLP
jgi:hypothetical protein